MAEERRTRYRGVIGKEKRTRIANRVVEFFEADQRKRSVDRNLRLQRYAKFRQWTSSRGDIPWPDASDVPTPDIPTSVLRTEDTLHNAVMSNRPAVVSRSLTAGDEMKQKHIDDLLDFQLFVEQNGEKVIEELADAFTKDGNFVAFIPWVRERREIRESRVFDPIPSDRAPIDHFQGILRAAFPGAVFENLSNYNANAIDDWDWYVTPDDERVDPFEVRFYTSKVDDSDEIEMICEREVEVYNGPKVIVPSYEDVVAPPRAANLQMPSPSNPNGAAHVILKSTMTIDEILRLHRSKFFDLLSEEDARTLLSQRRDQSDEGEAKQKDIMQGTTEDREEHDPRHETLTILQCFDIDDLNGDGRPEDVVYWVLKERKLLLRAKHLGELYPSNPPRRPFAEAQFLPIKGRREGIGLIELIEPLSDWKKVVADLMMDAGALTNTPFFFYRPSSGMNPETIRPWPGDGIPLSDPQNDVNFPQFNNATQVWAINLLGMLTQTSERLDLIGDLQLGRVPAGKSSALRTAQGISTILSQSEARPERILRRFFMGVTEIYKQMHELNQRYLPKDKAFRIRGYLPEGESPYRTLESTEQIRGRFTFDFDANVLNSSKAALQENLESLAALYVNEVTIQLGLVGPKEIHALLRDIGQARGQKPDKYLSPPTPEATLQRLTAEEAITAIHRGAKVFRWAPLEDPRVHLEKLIEFMQSDDLGLLDPTAIDAFKQYVQQTAALVEAAEKKQQIAAAAQGAYGQGGVPGTNGAAPPMGTDPTMLSPNELADESLPGAGGGANTGVQ